MPTVDVSVFSLVDPDAVVELVGVQGKGLAQGVTAAQLNNPVSVNLTGVQASGSVGTVTAQGLSGSAGRQEGSGLHLLWHPNSIPGIELDVVQGAMVTGQFQAVVDSGNYRDTGSFNFTAPNNRLAIIESYSKYSMIHIQGKKDADWQKHVWYANNAQALGAPKFEEPDWAGAWWGNDGLDVMEGCTDVNFTYFDSLTSGEQSRCIGIRINLNALAAEGTDPGSTLRDIDHPAWTQGSQAGPRPADYTNSTGDFWVGNFYDYIIDTVLPDPDGDPVYPIFLRGRALEEPTQASVRTKLQNAAAANKIGLLTTGIDHEPSSSQLNLNIQPVIDYAKNGNNTKCFAEPFGKRVDHSRLYAHWTMMQHQYWTGLCQLHCGFSFCGHRDEFVANYNHSDADIRAEWQATYDFIDKYAGWMNVPQSAPGAWIAYRQGLNLLGDYTFLASKVGASGTELYAGSGGDTFDSFSNDYVGPPSLQTASNPTGLDLNTSNYPNSSESGWASDAGRGQRQSIWARTFTNTSAKVALDSTFANSLGGGSVTVNVHYLDNSPTSSATVRLFDSVVGVLDFSGDTDEWVVFSATVPDVSPATDSDGAHVSVVCDNTVTLHMIEVSRG